MDKVNYREWFQSVGINTDDIVDVASDLLSVMIYCRERKVKFDANELIDALLETVGENGTVLIRTFNWDFCHGGTFDIRRTPSQVGSLGNIALKRKDFRRTQHPIYSWMVWGKSQKKLCELNNTEAFGEDSPFAFLYNNNGKHIRLGNTMNDVYTQRHFAELRANVPFRYEKKFSGWYIDEEGNKSLREYSMYVRRLDIEVGYHPFLMYPDATIETIRQYDNCTCASVRIKDATDYIYNDLINNNGRHTVAINGNDGYEELKK